MSPRIPTRLRPEFLGFMAAFDNEDLSDGAWFALLEEGGERFIAKHRLKFIDGNDAAHHYLRLKENSK